MDDKFDILIKEDGLCYDLVKDPSCVKAIFGEHYTALHCTPPILSRYFSCCKRL